MGVLDNYKNLSTIAPRVIKKTIATALEAKNFKAFTGPGANTKPKMAGRIKVISDALAAL